MKSLTKRDIELRFRTLDGINETKRYKSLEAAQTWFRRQFGDLYDVGGSYIVGAYGDAKVSVVRGCTLGELAAR